jgi:hypothetical protein
MNRHARRARAKLDRGRMNWRAIIVAAGPVKASSDAERQAVANAKAPSSSPTPAPLEPPTSSPEAP